MTRGGRSSRRRLAGTTSAASAPACWRSGTPSDRGGTTSGSAISTPGRRPPTSHTSATSAGNATRCPPRSRQAPTGARSAPRWPLAPGSSLPWARTGARRRGLCTGASGEHTPPHTNAPAPWGCPPVDSRAPAGPHFRRAPVPRVRALTPTRRRILQSPQHHASPTGGWAGSRQGPPPSAGGGRLGPNSGRGDRGARGKRCCTARPGGQCDGFPPPMILAAVFSRNSKRRQKGVFREK